jgi:uncharacterized protein (DUF427 family)
MALGPWLSTGAMQRFTHESVKGWEIITPPRGGDRAWWNHRGRRAVAPDMTSGHQITITPTQLHVEVSLGGEKLAESDRAVLLEETGLPARYYLPRQDVRTELLSPTGHHTTCPFKGQASYWSAEVGGEVHENLVWSYETPIPQAEGITGLMCFYNDQVELTVDGQRQPA